jgi:hypothetical protein
MTELSLRETAKRHGVSKGGLSKAVHADRPIEGMALHKYAVIDDGVISGFRFPEWYEIPSGEKTGSGSEFYTTEELCRESRGLSRGKVEVAVREGREIDGIDLSSRAVFDDEGGLRGFRLPDSIEFSREAHFDDLKRSEKESPDREGDRKRASRPNLGGSLVALGTAFGLSTLLD